MKFSIIIPTYNRIDLLERALESVNQQTYQNFEIIVVNDNPADRSSIDILAKKFDKLAVIHHTHPKGASAARNSGILKSSGELIAFLDDDDLWLPQKLSAHLREHQQHPIVGLVYSDCQYVYNNPLIKDRIPAIKPPLNILKAMARAEFCPPTSSIVSVKRECVEKCGLFDEELGGGFEDWDLWFRIAHVFEFSHVPKVLVHYRHHLGDRLSQNANNRRKGLEQVCNKWGNKIDTLEYTKKFTGIIYYKNSINALVAGEKLNAFRESFKLLGKKVITKNTIRNFIKINLLLITKR
jgi:glycosyltransferase involved in cell wall biosynthesis